MCNLLIIKGYKSFLGGGEGTGTKTFYGNHFTIEGHQRVIFWKIELGAHHGCTLPNINTSNWQYTLEHRKYGESVSVFNIIQCFSQCILTSNIHINCLILWFTKAIICCTGIFSCINPVDGCYGQHLSFLHHNSISLVPGLLFGPSVFGSGRPIALQVNFMLSPSRTFWLPLILVICVGTKSNETVTSKLQG